MQTPDGNGISNGSAREERIRNVSKKRMARGEGELLPPKEKQTF